MTFLVIVFAGVVIMAVVTLVAFVPAMIRSQSRLRSRFQAVGRAGLIILTLLCAATFLPLLVERVLPIQTWPGCKASIPDPAFQWMAFDAH